MCHASSSLKLPYYSEFIDKASLPKRDDILAGKQFTDRKNAYVVAVGDEFIVKFGPCVYAIEAENMIFIRENTTMPIPEVYAVYVDPADGWTYMIIEQVKGMTLSRAWAYLEPAQKQAVCAMIKSYVNELRSVPAPKHYGSLGTGKMPQSMFWNSDHRPQGPFQTETELHQAMCSKYLEFGGNLETANHYMQVASTIFHDHPPTLTHGDLQPQNILIRMNADKEFKVTLVDWESCGWYPSSWEFCMAMNSQTLQDDWHHWIPDMMGIFFAEFQYIKIICEGIWPQRKAKNLGHVL